MRRFFSLWVPVIIYAGIIFYLSSLSAKELPRVWISDKIVHLIEFSILGFLIIRAIDQVRMISLGKTLLFSTIIVLLYGFTDEIHQIFVSTREFSLFDLLFDGIGGLLGSLTYRWIK